MNGLEFLDLVIGLIFIYLIYSISASTIWEIVVNLTHMRGKMLRKWIINNFSALTTDIKKEDKTVKSNQILEHSLIKGLSGRKNSKPSYISSGTFTDVLLDLVIKADKTIEKPDAIIRDLRTFRDSISKTDILPEGLRGVFIQYADDASGNLQKLKDRISIWYDEAQEGLLGSYKKHLQRWILIISVLLVGFTNADTIEITSYLYNNDEVRTSIATRASFFVQDSSIANLRLKIKSYQPDSASYDPAQLTSRLDEDVKTLKALKAELDLTGIPVGWNIENLRDYKITDWLKKIGGLLLTALAVSMGSPFWFDVLSKLSNLRAAGRKPKTVLPESPVNEGKK